MVLTDATDPISSKCKRNKMENEEKFVLSTYSLTKLLNEDYTRQVIVVLIVLGIFGLNKRVPFYFIIINQQQTGPSLQIYLDYESDELNHGYKVQQTRIQTSTHSSVICDQKHGDGNVNYISLATRTMQQPICDRSDIVNIDT